ncbi:MAG TPA: hypothetical protein VKM72_30570 [Thermoanaerobaculia bacterium]|nr:hypothetical protein [Thermoanaerobaculia bacterium]
MWLPTLLFTFFAIFSAAGIFLIVSHHRSRAAGIAGALATLLLFVALYAGVLYLIGPLDQAH